MSDSQSSQLERIQVRTRFPVHHIQAFGFGVVDRVWVTVGSDGQIQKAEAELIDVPYKRMIIDDPHLLRIFVDRGQKIDVTLLHPRPKFRLDPITDIPDDGEDLDMSIFDVGRLVDITHLPAAARFGTKKLNLGMVDRSEEGAVHKRVRQTFEEEWAKQPLKSGKRRATSSAPRKAAVPSVLTPKRQQAEGRPPHTDSKSRNGIAPSKVKGPKEVRALSLIKERAEPEAARPVGYTPVPVPPVSAAKHRRATPLLSVPEGRHSKEMSEILKQILDRIPEGAHATYGHYIGPARKEAAQISDKKPRLHADLQDFVRHHDIVGLHNAFAKLGSKSGWRHAYQLPTFESNGTAAS
jgi:hypothetical protein